MSTIGDMTTSITVEDFVKAVHASANIVALNQAMSVCDMENIETRAFYEEQIQASRQLISEMLFKMFPQSKIITASNIQQVFKDAWAHGETQNQCR